MADIAGLESSILLAVGEILDQFLLEGILAGFILYTALLYWLQSRGRLPDSIGLQGPFITLHSQRGKPLLKRIASKRRLWRAWGNLGTGIALVTMGGMFLFLVAAAAAVLANPPPATVANQPRNVLVIPGVNDFLPISVAGEIVIGLLIGLVVHEGGHGILSLAEDIQVESVGLVFLAILPVGAFVEPDEESRDRCDRGGQTRMYAAGVTNNFAVAILAFALLFGPVIGAIHVAPGLAVGNVFPGSPADEGGISADDRIIEVNGTSIENESMFQDRLAAINSSTVAVRTAQGTRHEIQRRVFVVEAARNNPLGVGVNTTITAINGTAVGTRTEFMALASQHRIAEIETTNGTTTAPLGVWVFQVTPDGPLASAGAPAKSSITITAINGTRTVDHIDLSRAMEATNPSQSVSVEYYHNGSLHQQQVTLGENPDGSGEGFLGVQLTRGVSGIGVSDVGIRPYPASLFLSLLGSESAGGADLGRLGGGVTSYIGLVFFALMLPLGRLAGLEYNFAGFEGGIQSFYEVTGPLAVFGETPVFLLANVLFWTAWINIQLGFFNCIPAFPLDGGHILRMGTEAVLSRLPFEAKRQHVKFVTVSFGLIMLMSLIVMLFGPQFLQ